MILKRDLNTLTADEFRQLATKKKELMSANNMRDKVKLDGEYKNLASQLGLKNAPKSQELAELSQSKKREEAESAQRKIVQDQLNQERQTQLDAQTLEQQKRMLAQQKRQARFDRKNMKRTNKLARRQNKLNMKNTQGSNVQDTNVQPSQQGVNVQSSSASSRALPASIRNQGSSTQQQNQSKKKPMSGKIKNILSRKKKQPTGRVSFVPRKKQPTQQQPVQQANQSTNVQSKEVDYSKPLSNEDVIAHGQKILDNQKKRQFASNASGALRDSINQQSRNNQQKKPKATQSASTKDAFDNAAKFLELARNAPDKKTRMEHLENIRRLYPDLKLASADLYTKMKYQSTLMKIEKYLRE